MVEIMGEPNTCIRGCCSSRLIPLHLPASSFTLLSPIAKGSESTVFEALLLGQWVAAKKPVLSTSDDLDRFHRELQLLCKLDHPGLAKLVAAHARPPNYMFFFELYGSSNLAEKIHVEEWSPSFDEVLIIAIGIAEALEYLHKLGIVHRDIKPANILLDKELRPRVADFGLATYKDDLKPATTAGWKSSGRPTGGFHKKNMVGTLIYMAPEILSKGIHTEKSDVYSFAVTINELLTGVVPYTDLRAEAQAHTVLEMNYTEQKLTAAVVAEGLRPLLAKPEICVSPTLLLLIERCWNPDPLQRPSFDEVIQILKAIIVPAEEPKKAVKKNQEVSVFSSDTPPVHTDKHQSLREDVNWFILGAQVFSNDAADLKTGIWSSYLQNSKYMPKLSWGSFATCGRRETMEDTHILLPNFCNETGIHVFGIFDGHRGAAAAEFSARAVPGFLQQLCSTRSPADAMKEAFIRTDVAFRKELSSQYDSKRILQKDWHPGCTAITSLIIGNSLFVANAGDCRTVLCQTGKPLPLSKDHAASCPSERERIIKEGAEVKRHVDTWRIGAAGLQVTRSIGDDDLKPAVTAEPEIIETSLSAEDEFLVMASDGLWDVLSNEAVVGIVRDTVKEPSMCSKRLATEAAERGSRDNITVIVVFLRPVSTAERVF